jgi:hypothetical protein
LAEFGSRRSWIALVTSMALTACIEKYTGYRLEGTLLAEDGHPVSEATIYLYPKDAVPPPPLEQWEILHPDALGQWSFADCSLGSGNSQLRIIVRSVGQAGLDTTLQLSLARYTCDQEVGIVLRLSGPEVIPETEDGAAASRPDPTRRSVS